MRMERRRLVFFLLFAIAAPVLFWGLLAAARVVPPPGGHAFNLSDRIVTLDIAGEPGAPEVVFDHADGGSGTSLGAIEFLEEVRRRQEGNRGWRRLFSLLDITSWTSLLWVLFGLAGQALFMGRMLVQWLASERARASVVPPAFWWLSLVGSTMLMVYFVWRIEIVGFIGQSTGWFIYLRNLWFIYRKRES